MKGIFKRRVVVRYLWSAIQCNSLILVWGKKLEVFLKSSRKGLGTLKIVLMKKRASEFS